MDGLGSWLGGTHLAQALRDTSWAIPAIQCVHIAAIAVLVASSLIGQLRLAGLMATDVDARGVAGWMAPRVRWPLTVLLLSGVLMIVSEPERTLANAVFWTKLGLVACALLLSEVQVRRAALSARPAPWMRLVAVVVLLLWLGAIACGRWIAYLY